MAMRLIVLLLACGWLAGCGQSTGDLSGASDKGTLFVGILPDQFPEELLARNQPLIEYLEGALGRDLEIVIPNTYEKLVDAFDRGEVQLGWFDGLTFVQARERSGAIPIAMRQNDRNFKSVFLVPASSEATSIEDLRGSRLSFGPKNSTAGHMMPRYFLGELGIDPESFFENIQYSYTQSGPAFEVRDMETDVAVVDSSIFRRLIRDGDFHDGDVRVLLATPHFQNYVWAVRPEMGAELRESLVDAFLALDNADSDHRSIVHAQGSVGYLPAANEDFVQITKVARLQGNVSAAP